MVEVGTRISNLHKGARGNIALESIFDEAWGIDRVWKAEPRTPMQLESPSIEAVALESRSAASWADAHFHVSSLQVSLLLVQDLAKNAAKILS